ncbi:GNAT family N-acetyltransferase [Clostridium nigeriense]|uniref:GNAT family N-acetyltransferase n=1 Tax=Clostridium nigeriense TaxID=1805470 RepID=UPI00083457C5|nr:GNAT family N-acetyltransferase [Clostridium nigeriense]
MVGFDIRNIVKEDLEGVFRLNNSFDSSVINYQNEYKEHRTLVAQLNDDIIGYIKYEILNDETCKKILSINEVLVDEKYRGLGVGHQLMVEAEKMAKDYNITSLVVLNNNYLEEEVMFYKRQGFNLNIDRRYEKKYYIQ